MQFQNKSTLISIKLFLKITVFLSTVIHLVSCKKLVEINPPPNAITSENVYTDDATAIAVLTGIYTKMSNNNYAFVTGQNSISIFTGLSSDELTLAGGSTNSNLASVRFYTNKLAGLDINPWAAIYNCLITVNTAIEKLYSSNSLTPVIKEQLIAEAKFIRAFCYFYLVNLYGDVPLSLTSDYRINSNLDRTPKSEVYEQIVNDLKDAQSQLSEKWLDASLVKTSSDRVRPTKWAATALLARVYLYMGDWVNAESEATGIISNNSTFALSTLNNAFLKASLGNKEAIWQLQPVNNNSNTEDAKFLILNAAPGPLFSNKQVYLDTNLVKSFEIGDARRSNWLKDTVFGGVKYSYPYKYKIITGSSVNEHLMIFRLGEQYLIRAEARAQQNKLPEAIADLDKIRERAAVSLIANINPGITKSQLIQRIMQERRIELFTEWGHRWLDLKRTGNADAVMSIVTPNKGGSWHSNWLFYPIPTRDLLLNTKLSQNSGY